MRVSQAGLGALLGAALFVPKMGMLSPVAAAVYSSQQALPPQVIKDFLADPSALLKQYPEGGAQMISRVKDLAASDPATLNAIVGLLATANSSQATAIGTALGQVALIAVKTDQAYANQIQEAIAAAMIRHDVGSIGHAVKTKGQVEGVTEKGTQAIAAGTEIYQNEQITTGPSSEAEFLFADRSNLTVGPASSVRIDNFVYDPKGGAGNVVIEVTHGTFRFITGVQPTTNYEIKTPSGALRARGAEGGVLLTSPAGSSTGTSPEPRAVPAR